MAILSRKIRTNLVRSSLIIAKRKFPRFSRKQRAYARIIYVFFDFRAADKPKNTRTRYFQKSFEHESGYTIIPNQTRAVERQFFEVFFSFSSDGRTNNDAYTAGEKTSVRSWFGPDQIRKCVSTFHIPRSEYAGLPRVPRRVRIGALKRLITTRSRCPGPAT